MEIVSASGSITSQELIKSLTPDPQNPTAGRQALTPKPQGQPQSRRPEGYSTPAAIYSPFISAVTGAIGLHLIRSYGALPLGSRTLFTAVETLGYDDPRIDNEGPLSLPCLTTINVQLNSPGTLTVSIQTISQPGISRLSSPWEDTQDVLQAQPGTDIWLCPNGSVARLVTANIDSPNVPSPGAPTTANTIMRRRQWKLDLAQWLGNFGLDIDSVDDEIWVEVEVWEPIFAKLAGESWRQNEDSQPSFPLKRMLWPARFCFRRPGPSMHASWLQNPANDPLEFAERWSSEAGGLQFTHPSQSAPPIQEIQAKDYATSSPRTDNVDGFESLSRMSQYPDLPPTNLVYPTPPEGTATTGLTNPTTDDADLNFSPAIPPDSKNMGNSELVQNPVGTGNYDASDEEDLFGEMNERDFGSKGITDADFSFFDDPDLEDMDMEIPDQPEEPEKHPEIHEADLPETSGPEMEIPVLEENTEGKGDPEDRDIDPTQPEDFKPPEPIDDNPFEGHVHQSPDDEEGQTISPPLSPVEVKKILFPGEDKEATKDVAPQHGHYLPVAFERKIGDWDQKYGSAGKFWFASRTEADKSSQSANTIPTIGLPHRARGASNAQHKSTSKTVPEQAEESDDESTSDSDSESSDGSSYIVPESAVVPSTLPSLKRKRVPSESDILSAASPAKSTGPIDGNPNLKVENGTFLGNFLANFSDWTFIGFFSAFQTQQLPVLIRREDHIQIAQLLVDQVIQSSLNHPLTDGIGLFDLETQSYSWEANLEDSSFHGDVSRLDLKAYISLQEDSTPPAQQPTKEPIKSMISRTSAPHLRVRRGKEYLETLPSAVSFWETFGLEPAHGAKDVSAYCIHPTSAAKAADAFLSRFGLHYQGCNFGTHVRGDQSMGFENGLRSWESETSSYTSMMHGLKTICRELGKFFIASYLNFY